MQPRRRHILFGILLFFALDAAIFRSGLYARLISFDSMQGFATHVARNLERYRSDPQSDVLVLGDSRVSEGFNAGLATRQQAGSGLVFLQGGIPGSTLRSICFMLERIDPHADRFRAIVIAVRSYRQAPTSEPLDDDRMLDADLLAPLISTPAMIELASYQPLWSQRVRLWSRMLVSAMAYRADFNDLLLHPRKRRQGNAWIARMGVRQGDDYQGQAQTMAGLVVSPDTGALIYPAWLNQSQRDALTQYFRQSWPAAVPAEDAYRLRWIGRILRRYGGSQTHIFLLRVPVSPLPQIFHDQDFPLASFVGPARAMPSVTVLPEAMLAGLEQPADFFDGHHLNAAGRVIMTRQLGDAVRADLPPRTAAAAIPASWPPR
jgi:hypothetical protein